MKRKEFSLCITKSAQWCWLLECNVFRLRHPGTGAGLQDSHAEGVERTGRIRDRRCDGRRPVRPDDVADPRRAPDVGALIPASVTDGGPLAWNEPPTGRRTRTH